MDRRVLNSLAACLTCVIIAALLGWAGSYGGESVGSIRIFALCVLVSFVINWGAYVPSYLARTEHYYDLTGSATYLSVTAIAILFSDRDPRSVVIAVMVAVWALRLGTFLFRRVRRAGGDSRFDKIKNKWARFLMFWTIQALWVIFTLAAGLAAITSGAKDGIGPVGVLGTVIWLIGFGVEVVSDRQKSAFRADAANKGRFISTGLWAWSRHPNYVGEFTLWFGVAILAAPALQGWQFVTLLSPVFVWFLLNRISGVPALEKGADDRWGGDADYERYKAATPVFWPRPPRAG